MSNDPNQTGQQGNQPQQDPNQPPVKRADESDAAFQQRQDEYQRRQGQTKS